MAQSGPNNMRAKRLMLTNKPKAPSWMSRAARMTGNSVLISPLSEPSTTKENAMAVNELQRPLRTSIGATSCGTTGPTGGVTVLIPSLLEAYPCGYVQTTDWTTSLAAQQWPVDTMVRGACVVMMRTA